jgi:hypothetical protein
MPSILAWLATDSMITSDDSTYHLALVGPPYDRLIVYDILGRAGARHHFAIGDVERVENAHDGVLSRARSLFFLQQLAVDVLTDEWAKIRGMQLDSLLEFFEEKHVARYTTGTVVDARGGRSCTVEG